MAGGKEGEGPRFEPTSQQPRQPDHTQPLQGRAEGKESLQGPTTFEETEVKRRIDQAQQAIVEHLKNAELESPRFQAFADFADLCHATYRNKDSTDGMFAYNTALIAETIRQRKNGIKGYATGSMKALHLAGDLGEALEDSYADSEYANKNSKIDLALKLRGVKNDEINRKNKEPSDKR